MNKKQLLIGLAFVGVAATSSAATVAAARYLPWTVNIYSISDEDRRDDGSTPPTVSTFDDRGNKCYVARAEGRYTEEADSISISCVRMR